MFKLMSLLVVLALSSCAQLAVKDWSFDKKFINPESVYFNSLDNHIYVSSVSGQGTEKNGEGFISKLSADGEVIDLKWATGLNAPKGSRAHNGTLWVSDIDEVVAISLENAEIIKRYKVKNAKFLNDIAITESGIVYVSDSLTSKIHKIENQKVSLFKEGSELESPNGLLVVGERLYVAAWGLTTDWSTKQLGRLYYIDLKSKKKTLVTESPLGNLDGLELDENGDFLVSDYVAGLIYRINKKSFKYKVVYKGKRSLADIGYNKSSKQFLIPYMELGQVFSASAQK